MIAVEPHPYTFKLLKQNININRLEDAILPINAGLNGERRNIPIRFDIVDTWGLGLRNYLVDAFNNSDTHLIPLITLDDILDVISEHRSSFLKWIMKVASMMLF